VGDAATGGITDVRYLLGFGNDLSSPYIPVVEAGLHRTVRHILDGGVKGVFPTVAKSSLPALIQPPRSALWHGEVLRLEGLFPCRFPDARVFCPSHRMPTRWTVCTLTIGEKLQLFRMPLAMDGVLGGLRSSSQLPFADSPLPEIYTSIFRQLWGVDGGGELVAGVGHNVEEEEEEKDVAGGLGHNMEEEKEVTDRPLWSAGSSVVDDVVGGDGDTAVPAVLPDTDGPSGPSVVDKGVGGDGDATVLVVLPEFGGEGGTKPAGAEWGGPTGSPPTLETPLVMDLPEYIDNNLQSAVHLQGMTVARPDASTSARSDKWACEFDWNV
jgi:hypothetical protein